MPPFLQFLIRRFLIIPLTLLVVTMLLYGGLMLTPAEARAQIYMPNTNARLTEKQIAKLIENIIERYHLDEPYLVQYTYWVGTFFDEGHSGSCRKRPRHWRPRPSSPAR